MSMSSLGAPVTSNTSTVADAVAGSLKDFLWNVWLRTIFMSTKKSSAIDGISYIPSDSLALSIRKLTFKENRSFGVTDVRGEIPRDHHSELGIYFNDTRYLNTWQTLINGTPPVPLSQELRHQGSTWVLSMTNRDLSTLNGSGRIPRDTILIRRLISLHRDGLYEMLTIKNSESCVEKYTPLKRLTPVIFD
ncbi:hypothetical protein EBZ37_08470 [bacterium]|nr:hypothetical protein [bacterium]